MEQHRWNIFGPNGELLATVDADKVEPFRPNAVSIYHNKAGIAVWFPVFGIRIEQEF